MPKIPISDLNGGSKKDVTAPPQDMLSTNEANKKSTSATLGETAQPKTNSQRSNNSALDGPEALGNMIIAFGAKLGVLVFWKKLELIDGREVYALCFPTTKWKTGEKGELIPK